MKILNLYGGIGGNRLLWKDCSITTIEIEKDIAQIYKYFFPDDEIIITDAHEYLLNNFMKFDFIWSSPPCQSHSRLNRFKSNNNSEDKSRKPKYPNLKLYEEIIFLKQYYKGLYCVENVKPYYQPLIQETAEIQRHLFWTNFNIKRISFDQKHKNVDAIKRTSTHHGFNLKQFKTELRKDTILRNIVNPEISNHILNCARKIETELKVKPLELQF